MTIETIQALVEGFAVGLVVIAVLVTALHVGRECRVWLRWRRRRRRQFGNEPPGCPTPGVCSCPEDRRE